MSTARTGAVPQPVRYLRFSAVYTYPACQNRDFCRWLAKSWRPPIL